jgi:Raf kinase inhibitor-like YbhB/YbcL family protein
MAFSLTSSKFQNDAEIPIEHTREGRNVSPPLEWHDIPPGTQSLALVCEDPDAPDPAHPQKTFVHWVVYNISNTVSGLPENIQSTRRLPPGAHAGTNDWGQMGYGGPAPPIGRHRYFFRLYALDTMLPDESGLTRAKLDRRMQGHIISTAELVGTYQSTKQKPGRAA